MINGTHLLYIKEEKEGICSTTVIEDLLFHETFSRFIDRKSLDAFLKILQKPLTDPENIQFRRDIIEDFISNPGILDLLLGMIDELTENKKNNESSSGVVKYRRNTTGIQMCALSLRTTLQILQRYADRLDGYHPVSAGLTALCNKLSAMISMRCKQLISLCEEIEGISAESQLSLHITLNDYGRISNASVIAFNTGTTPPTRKRSFFNLFGNENQNYVGISIDPEIKNCGYEELMSVLRRAEFQTQSSFKHLKDELLFYRAACKYCDFCSSRELPMIYPDISSEKDTKIEKLHDLYLEANDVMTVPNSFSLAEKMDGALIFGKNSSGKTVYLRAVGTAQLLMQAGLPIAAASAVMCLRDGVCTLFASAEKSNMSRFETEAATIDEYLGTMPSNTFYLFNEPFQSTEYKEGAEGLFHILRALTYMGNKWMVVTHLYHLGDAFSGDRAVSLVRMGDNHVVKPYAE